MKRNRELERLKLKYGKVGVSDYCATLRIDLIFVKYLNSDVISASLIQKVKVMAYRSERFPAGELKGFEKAWQVVDGLESIGLPVRTEVLAGRSHRRQLDSRARAEIGDANYVLQAVLSVPKRDDKRITARYFIDESRRLLVALDAPGEVAFDEGGLHGLDPSTTKLAFGSTGRTEDDVLRVYAPWLSSKWTEAGKSCMFFCGIEPPQPRSFMEEYPVSWDERAMRRGAIVFEPTPADLTTH